MPKKGLTVESVYISERKPSKEVQKIANELARQDFSKA